MMMDSNTITSNSLTSYLLYSMLALISFDGLNIACTYLF